MPAQIAQMAPDLHILDPKDAPSLRWGILGAGGIASTFSRDVPRYSTQQVRAIGSRSLDKAQTFAAEHDIPYAFGSYEELVSSDQIDAVYVATPHIRHAADAILALQAGKPALVEKPFTMNRAEAETVFALAQKKNLFAMEAMWSRHLPHYRFIEGVVRAGVSGAEKNVVRAAFADHGQILTGIPRIMEPSLGGGALLDLCVYPLHFLHMILGEPVELQALGRPTGTGVDAAEVVICKYKEALGVASSNMDGRSATSAAITFDDFAIDLPYQFYRPGMVQVRYLDVQNQGLDRVVSWDATVPGGFQYQVADAARCIAAGETQSEVVTWADTLAVMGMIDLVAAKIGV